MHLKMKSGARGLMKHAVVICALSALAACSSPAEKANAYYEKGMSLMKEDKIDKARLEFQNALQIDKNLVKAMYGLALVAEKKKDIKQEYGWLNKVVEQDPGHFEAQVKLGQLLLAANKLDKAKLVSDKAIALKKDDSSAMALQAAVMLKSGNAEDAVRIANQILAKDPASVDAILILASERVIANDFAKALTFLEQGRQRHENNISLALLTVESLDRLGKADEVEQTLRKISGFYPNDPGPHKLLAKFYLKHGKSAEAEAELRQLVKQSPKDFDTKIELVRFLTVTKGAAAGRQELESFVKQQPDDYALKFALVEFYATQKDGAAVETSLKEIAEKAGTDANGLKAKGMLATLSYAKGDAKTAAQMVSEILNSDKRNEQALLLKATMEVRDGKFDDAISDLRTVLRDAPNSSKTLLMLAQVHERAGSVELAEENYLKAFQASKMDPAFGMPYALFLFKHKQGERAEKTLEDIIAKSPNYGPAVTMLARSRLQRGDGDGALALVEQLKKTGDREHLADQITGALLAAKKDFSGSIEAYKRAYEAAPGSAPAAMQVVRAYLQAGKTKEAIAFIEAEAKANPNNLDLRMVQGRVYASNRQLPQAIAVFKSLIDAAPKQTVGYQQLAALYLQSSQIADAEKVIAQGLAVIPGDISMRLTQAGIYEATNRIEDAIKAYEGLLKDKPDAEVVINNLANLLADRRTDQGSHQRAYELAQKLKSKGVPQFNDTIAWAGYRVGKYDDAILLLQEAIKVIPNEPTFHYHLGMVYLGKADKASARKELETALQLAGNGAFGPADEIRKLLKSL